MNRSMLLLLLTTCASEVSAGPRASGSYSIAADIADAGGGTRQSASYTLTGSLGGVTGAAAAGGASESGKGGYLGQLYDPVAGIMLAARPASINEGGTGQLIVARNLDDGTGLALDPATAAWAVLAGPITSISANGVATAGTVYQDTTATVRSVASGFTAYLALTIVNVNLDDLPGYANDGIDDAWQVQYFGPGPNASAGPNVDFDGTGQTNFFKYIAGLNPLDPSSRFKLTIAAVPGQPSQMSLSFGPIVAGRSYTITAAADPGGRSGWAPIIGSLPSDHGADRTITDLNASGGPKFYRVEITKP